MRKKFNEYDFVKFNFIKDVMLLQKKEFFVMGVIVWCILATILLLIFWVLTLIYQL